MKKFAVFDIDGTLIRWQLYHSLVDELGKQMLIDATDMREIKESRMNWKKRSDTFSQYQNRLVESFHRNLPHIPPQDFDKAVDTVFDRYKDQVYTYTRDLIGQLKKEGYLLLALSGSQHEMISKLGKYYGFDIAIGNTYERSENGFTGKHENLVHRKQEILKELVTKHDLSWSKSIAVGDSGSDAQILELTEQPIAFNPDLELLRTAQEREWKIVVERKNAIFELEAQDGKYRLAKTNA